MRRRPFLSGMVVVKIDEASERRLHIECLRISVQRRAWLHLDRKGANPSHIGEFSPYLPQNSDSLAIVRFLFEGEAEGEEKVTINLMLFQLLKTSHQGPIGVSITLVNPSQPVRPCARGEDDQGFGSGECLFEGFDQFDRGQPEGFKETFHLQPLLTNQSEKAEKIVRLMGIGIETM